MIEKEGIYIATREGFETLIIKIEGTAPLLEITSAINLSLFQETGEVKSYKTGSSIVKELSKNPEKYLYRNLTMSDTIIQKQKSIQMDLQVPQAEFDTYIKYYRSHKQNKISLIQFIYSEKKGKLSLTNCEEIAEKVIYHHKTVIEYEG